MSEPLVDGIAATPSPRSTALNRAIRLARGLGTGKGGSRRAYGVRMWRILGIRLEVNGASLHPPGSDLLPRIGNPGQPWQAPTTRSGWKIGCRYCPRILIGDSSM